MSGRNKRAASSNGKNTTKKARFKPIAIQSGQDGTNGADASGSSQSTPRQVGHVHIDNINMYTSVDGRRIGKQTGTRLVAVNPAEYIFSRAQASDRDGGVAQSSGDDSVAAILGDFPVDDAEALQDGDSADVQLAPKKRAKARDWLPFRAEFLDELLRYEGCPEPMEDGDLPLHRPERWTGKCFQRTTLREVGLEIQLGHSRGACKHPSKNTHRVVVADVHGVQAVQVRFCECLDVQNDLTREWCQLFREGWFPATTLRPTTVFTFQLLDTFQELNLQGKTNLYDFWKSIECLTDNSGQDVYGRYKELSHVVRLWRHLVSLKRFGRAHDPDGPGKTKEGTLAFECPACPQPGKNLPEHWETAPEDKKWLYTLFLMMDANFRARCKDRGFDDISLASGWAYYVEEARYQEHLKARSGDKQDENTCSAEHNAIAKAGLRKEGYIASGVGAVLCARHAMVRPNGTGDLQLGERQANMDYLFFSAVMGVLLALMISYNIVCQWYRHLWARMTNLPPAMQIARSRLPTVRFGIPKEHIRVHGPGHSKFSFNFLRWVGRTYGEGVESHWAFMNPIALSAHEMSLSSRQELMNDHWGSWNWRKIVAFGPALFRAFEEAHTMQLEHARIFRDYSATFDAQVVQTWEALIAVWDEDPESHLDPYEEPQNDASAVAAVKHEIALEDTEDINHGRTLESHEVTPGVFLQVGLEIEEQQRGLRVRKLDGSSLKDLTEQQTKRNALLRRIGGWQAVQDVHMPMVSALRAGTGTAAPGDPIPGTLSPSLHPESVPLFLPSSLPPSLRALESLANLLNKEKRLRVAQLSDTLQDIRHLRRILAAISDYTRRNVNGEGQRATTRFRGLYGCFQTKCKRASERYRAAHTAMLNLDPSGDWSTTYRVLLDADLRGPRKEDMTSSEGRYEVSWIWLSPTSTTRTADFAMPATAEDFAASMRIEWARAKARADRWAEEEQLLLEEMRRVLEYCRWKATWWRSQADRRGTLVPPPVLRGLRAYADKQAGVWEGVARRSASYWINYVKKCGPLPEWLKPYEKHARKVRFRDFSKRISAGVQGSDGEQSSESSGGEDEDEDE
ncbi:hypothetical protein TRAPUB_11697 [Trametes pubescens]|uniref:CxC2-like cysteine cluster KDZ transposase-associated domain-containing protein n=1 Tax=Trametes pubescens TaxID=154538 RepID=A0A1M2VVX0_TRAPU|nr:hypothetical protein TRAPUB_11697 [Trametes pubescens]